MQKNSWQPLANGLPPRVAVVGCAGFIGSHLIEVLLQQDVEVWGWDQTQDRIQALLQHPLFHFEQVDYSSEKLIQQIAQENQVVIHLAALCNPSLYNTQDVAVIESNYHHPARLAKACAQAGTWLIFFSTSEVYGSRMLDSTLREDQSSMIYGPVNARRWSYATAKQLMERWITALSAEHDFPWTVVRPFNFLGPRMDFIPGWDGDGLPRVMACFMEALLKGKPLQLVDHGTSLRAFTWIGDAIEAVLHILQHPQKSQGQAFNIGNADNEVSIAQLAQRMIDLWQQMQQKQPSLPAIAQPAIQPVTALEFYGPGYEDSIRRLPDIQKAEHLLGWKAHTGLDVILRETMQWFAKHYLTLHSAVGATVR